jgi:hypothetical protein
MSSDHKPEGSTVFVSSLVVGFLRLVIGNRLSARPHQTKKAPSEKPGLQGESLVSHSVGLSRHPTLAQKLRRSRPYDAKMTPQSTDVRNPFLGFGFSRCDRLRRKLEHSCFPTFQHVGQQHHLPIGKFQRIVMRSRVVLIDLPKDGRGVLEYVCAEQPPASVAPYRSCKRKLCCRKNANRCVDLFRGSKAACAGIEELGSQFVTDLSWT